MGIINQLITGGAPPCIYRFRSDSDDHCFGSFRGTVENVWDPVSLPWFCLPCLSMGNNILHTWETTCAFYCKKQTHLETIYSKTHVYNCIYIYIHIYIYIFGWTKSCFPCICPQIKLTVYTLISFAGTASSSGSWLQSIQSKDGVPSKHVLHHHHPNSIWRSYWKWPFIVDFPIKNGDFP